MYATLYCYNLYQPGQGIMAHQDGPLYTPKVAILSLVGRKKKRIKHFTAKKINTLSLLLLLLLRR